MAVIADAEYSVGGPAALVSNELGGHWRQRIGVEIVRGLARCIERAATGGQVGGQAGGPASSLEWSQDCI